MKTLKQIIKAIVLVASVSLVVACDNKKNSNNTVGQNGYGAYQLNQYGQCISSSNGQQVPQSYCTSGYNSGYQYNNFGQCIMTSSGQAVDPMYCQNSTGYGQQCNGNYWVWTGYNWSQIQCYGTNCSGQTVYPAGATSQAQAIRCL